MNGCGYLSYVMRLEAWFSFSSHGHVSTNVMLGAPWPSQFAMLCWALLILLHS